MNPNTDELIPAAHSAEFEKAFERLMGEAKFQQDILERPIGPTLQCYSIKHMVDLFRWGAGKADVAHLSTCYPCQSWANKYAQTESARAAQEKVLAKPWKERIADWFGRPAQPVPVAPMLYVKQEIIPAGKPLEIALVAGIADRYRLDPSSLKLEGGLTSNRGTILQQRIEGIDCAVVRFEHVVWSDSLKEDVRNHATVVQNVSLVGKFVGDAGESFRGQANLHIGSRPASA